MSKNKTVPENETGEERFRRVFGQRIKPVQKYMKMIQRMPTQPNYNISSHDAELVLDEINNLVAPILVIYAKAKLGSLKTEEIKEYSGVDWDKELEKNTEETTEE